ncbi:hypothetical protein BGX38DRAFT_701463 [Terfezia claveryi]|nr:hypothetical protein BGX38DRAFT_701463 [Terfezia claveryi]
MPRYPWRLYARPDPLGRPADCNSISTLPLQFAEPLCNHSRTKLIPRQCGTEVLLPVGDRGHGSRRQGWGTCGSTLPESLSTLPVIFSVTCASIIPICLRLRIHTTTRSHITIPRTRAVSLGSALPSVSCVLPFGNPWVYVWSLCMAALCMQIKCEFYGFLHLDLAHRPLTLPLLSPPLSFFLSTPGYSYSNSPNLRTQWSLNRLRLIRYFIRSSIQLSEPSASAPTSGILPPSSTANCNIITATSRYSFRVVCIRGSSTVNSRYKQLLGTGKKLLIWRGFL